MSKQPKYILNVWNPITWLIIIISFIIQLFWSMISDSTVQEMVSYHFDLIKGETFKMPYSIMIKLGVAIKAKK